MDRIGNLKKLLEILRTSKSIGRVDIKETDSPVLRQLKSLVHIQRGNDLQKIHINFTMAAIYLLFLCSGEKEFKPWLEKHTQYVEIGINII